MRKWIPAPATHLLCALHKRDFHRGATVTTQAVVSRTLLPLTPNQSVLAECVNPRNKRLPKFRPSWQEDPPSPLASEITLRCGAFKAFLTSCGRLGRRLGPSKISGLSPLHLKVWRTSACGDLRLARPCHHCTKSLFHFARKYFLHFTVTFSTGNPREPWARRLSLQRLCHYGGLAPSITFGNLPQLLARVHSWVMMKGVYADAVREGKKTVENRPARPKKGSWKGAPLPNRRVLLGIVACANRKENKPAHLSCLAEVEVRSKEASKIYIVRVIPLQRTPLARGSGFPGFVSNLKSVLVAKV